ncbi:hypothetical protein [Salarchaeum sp. JOR-1]|uniref:hypothetical protein n=1 Tax=Salarchaeum sp. JOR-1 TaxID=2599399 RepID=UPI00143DFFF9|nr:hypothetical protein [Salarchaeum sp. JOR-1]
MAALRWGREFVRMERLLDRFEQDCGVVGRPLFGCRRGACVPRGLIQGYWSSLP